MGESVTKLVMNKSTSNFILPNATHLEELPNELFFLIFSYLKADMVIQTFVNLNQRFESLILQYARHLVLSDDIQSEWINEYMLLIKNEIETITLSVNHLGSVFSVKYSYPNLRTITMYSGIEWQIELNVENESPVLAIISSLNILKKCCFKRLKQDLSTIFPSAQITQATRKRSIKTYSLNDSTDILPCSAVQRIWVFECFAGNLWELFHLTPGLTYFRTWLCPSTTPRSHLKPMSVWNTIPAHVTELHFKIVDLECFQDVQSVLRYCQTSLKQITLDLGGNVVIDGKKLESLLAPCPFLENISFISQFSKKQINSSDLLNSFKSEWWLDTARPPVLIHESNVDLIFAVSIPCSCANVLKHLQLSTDLNSWHLNKGTLDSLPFACLITKKICFSSKQPIPVDFLQLAARIFYCQKQSLECHNWGLIFEKEPFQQFIDQSTINVIFPHVTRFKITYTNGLTPLILATWLLIAPNVRILEIEYLTFSELMEWITDLYDAIIIDDQRFIGIFQRIQKIIMSAMCYNCKEKSRLEICSILTKVFSNAVIA